jgi:hypothetical protein
VKVLCSQEVVSPHLCEVVPCQVTAKASTPPVPGVVLCVWLQKGIRENMAWFELIDFYAFSCGSFRKLARNLIEIAQRKSQVSQKTLVSFTDLSKMQTLTPLKSQKTTGYCWSSSFHATWLLLLRWILEVFGPSMQARSKHDFRHLGVDQQYPTVFRDTHGPYHTSRDYLLCATRPRLNATLS